MYFIQQEIWKKKMEISLSKLIVHNSNGCKNGNLSKAFQFHHGFFLNRCQEVKNSFEEELCTEKASWVGMIW